MTHPKIPSLTRDEVFAFRDYLLTSRRPTAAILAYSTCLLDDDCDPGMVAGFALAVLGRIDAERKRWALELSLGVNRTIERMQADFVADYTAALAQQSTYRDSMPDGFPADFADEVATVDDVLCLSARHDSARSGLVMTGPDVMGALAEITAPIGPRRQAVPRAIEVLTRDDVMAMLIYGARREYVVDLCDALLTDVDDKAPLNARDVAAFACLLEVERQRWALAVEPSLRDTLNYGKQYDN